MILKEVLRKKHNAKKFISKLDALKKLRGARLNTVKGRGENTSLYESEEFEGKIGQSFYTDENITLLFCLFHINFLLLTTIKCEFIMSFFL